MEAVQVKPFFFKQFTIHQDRCTMKIGTDGVLLGAWADVSEINHALDIGAGSGVIAIMLGQRTQKAFVHAVEIDGPSFEQAHDNMQQAPWANRLDVFHQSIQQFARTTDHRYDLIVSNPPFFSGGTFSHNQDRNSVRHTIKLPHGDLLSAVRTLLSANGRFCVVLPYIEGLRFQELAASYHLYPTAVTEVHARPQKPVERLLIQLERKEKPLKRGKLAIQEETGEEWTEQYKELTQDFYLKI